MKRLSILSFLGLLTAAMFGCPVYGDSSDCHHHGGGQCFNNGYGGGEEGVVCQSDAECPTYTTCGKDGACHSGDCTMWGCPGALSCQISSDNGYPTCEPVEASTTSGTGGAGGGGTSTGGGGQATTTSSGTGAGGGGGAAPIVYCGRPSDCASGTTCSPSGMCESGLCSATGCVFGYACSMETGACGAKSAKACDLDADCSSFGTGFTCIDGSCIQPADQCFDQTQCQGAAEECASGKCTPACAVDTDCPSSFKCNTTTGACTTPATACTITNDCGAADVVCVGGACVPRSAGATCPSGSIWIENGCVAPQGAKFDCTAADGSQGECQSGSVCLHHSCYTSCQDQPSACSGSPSSGTCDSITTSSGTLSVCGSADGFGTDCDVTKGQACFGGEICVDGVCK